MQSTFLNWFVMETTRSIREPIRTQLIKGFGRGTMGENQHHAAQLLIVHTLRETPVVEMWSSDEGSRPTVYQYRWYASTPTWRRRGTAQRTPPIATAKNATSGWSADSTGMYLSGCACISHAA